MTEPLTDRLRAILDALGDGTEDLTKFTRLSAIAISAFGSTSHMGRLRNELGALQWRGMVESNPMDPDAYRITPEGMEARG